MKVLVVHNEDPLGSHPDMYEALQDLQAEGLVTDYDVVPHLHLQRSGWSDADVVDHLRELVRGGEPDVVLWRHTRGLDVPERALDAIGGGPRGPSMVYWEADSYHPVHKPVPPEMVRVMRRCDDVYLPCGGPVVRSLARAGVSSLRYAPSCASATRFPYVWNADENHDYDVVVIGNRVRSRLPFRTMPGARRRSRVTARLVGDGRFRVAVFGRGWEGPSAKGSTTFEEQSTVYRSARLTVGINNSTYPYVFSNRLPVALASGIPLLYHANPGFSAVFGDELRGVFFAEERQVLDRVQQRLSEPPEQLTEKSLAGRRFFERNLTTTVVARHILERAQCRRTEPAASVSAAESRWQAMPALIPG